ncbi:5-oxoprolinase subunit C family protein [Frateuria aurantia]
MIRWSSKWPLSSVQDLGRYGHLASGVGTSGAMDQLALMAGNVLLGNAVDEAAIEVQMFPARCEFLRPGRFALTGADCRAKLNGQAVPPWWLGRARQGDVLELLRPQHGARAYLCLPGGIDVPRVLGSRSTQLRGAFGGLEGRCIMNGDQLRWRRQDDTGPADFGLLPPASSLARECDGLPAIRVLPAAEYMAFGQPAREDFWCSEWQLSSQSDRYGYRMTGPTIALEQPMDIRSHGIVPGVIQIPPGGQPIIQMRDAQPSGGYPKFGTVIEADLWRLGQTAIGSRMRFVLTDYDTAIQALAENRQWLQRMAAHVALYY